MNIHNLQDDDGNTVIIEQNNDLQTAKVFLKLQGKENNNRRLVGVIDYNNRRLVIKRNREKHLFRKSQSYGFNHAFLNNATRFDEIVLHDEYGTHKAQVKDILEYGDFLYFKQNQFEKQIFYPLSKFE